MSMRLYNKIQVFGLPRSGTNFIEWTLRNNFGMDVSPMHEIQNDVEGSFPYWTDFKHGYPTLSHSQFAVVIWKDYDEWKESIKRQGWVYQVSKETHQKYIDKGIELGENCIVVNHRWAVENYNELLNTISSKFGVKLVDNPIQPNKRIDMIGQLTNEDYV